MLKHIHTIIINSLLVVLFLGIIAMPMTSLGLMSYKSIQDTNKVLSAQNERPLKEREAEEIGNWTEQEIHYYENMIKVPESTESTPPEVSE